MVHHVAHHLGEQAVGATPTQEIAYSLACAIGVLDAVRDSGQVAPDAMGEVVASVSFFVNAGIRFIEENCKMRAFTQMWDRLCEERYGVTDPKARRFRYGVQVNSLGLTEAQPENNIQRIVLEALGVTLSKSARARSLQLPAWNEALGLPRPWDQQWSLRIMQVLAFETDLLEYGDIFEGSKVIEGLTAELVESAQAELDDILALGGAFEAIDEMKGRLVRSHTERMRRIESGEQMVIGVNAFTETAKSPLGGEDNILKVDPAVQAAAIDELAEGAQREPTQRSIGAEERLDERVGGDPPPESELEARFRRLCERHDLPGGVAQLPAPWDDARSGRHRVDVGYPDDRVIVEVDGRTYHAQLAAFQRDRVRDQLAVAGGWRPLWFTWWQVTREEAFVVRILRSVLTLER